MMLEREPHTHYYVYPSWAELSYRWSDMRAILSRPLASGYVNPDPAYWKELGYPDRIQPAELLEGPAGGGIIVAHIGFFEHWLPRLILAREANTTCFGMMGNLEWQLAAPVSYLEPRDEPGAEWGLGKRAKSYLCPISTEHVEAAGSRIYWMMEFKGAEPGGNYVDEVKSLGLGFGLQISSLSSDPDLPGNDTPAWVADATHKRRWFEVSGGGNRLGYQFAIMGYVALHMAWRLKNKIGWFHMIAAIQGEPHVRRNKGVRNL